MTDILLLIVMMFNKRIKMIVGIFSRLEKRPAQQHSFFTESMKGV